jgi:xanthine dehydrogenase large subunit
MTGGSAGADGTPVVGVGVSDESATLHVTGRATFVDDIPEPEGTVHGYPVLSDFAHGRITSLDVSRALRQDGVLAVLTSADVPGVNSHAPRIGVDPILADDVVVFLGQPVAMVVASTRAAAQRADRLVRVEHEPLAVVLNARDAHAAGSHVVPPMHMVQPSVEAVDAALSAAPHRRSGSVQLGGQEHFYLECMAALASVMDDGGVLIRSSTQHPSEVQQVVARALGVPHNRVRVECRRMGGAFGGKESQAAQVSALAALGAACLGRPVKVRLDRFSDDRMTGKRHPFAADWDMGFDDEGHVLGYRVTLISTAGHSTDLSGPVLTRAVGHVDNAYWLPAVAVEGYAARTNTRSTPRSAASAAPKGRSSRRWPSTPSHGRSAWTRSMCGSPTCIGTERRLRIRMPVCALLTT